MLRSTTPLTERELRLLLETNYDDMLRVFPRRSRRFLIEEKKRAAKLFPPEIKINLDAERARAKSRERELDQLYKAALVKADRLENELRLVSAVPEIRPRELKIEKAAQRREATAVALASDWHAEELVFLESTNGLNEYNLAVFKERSKWYFANLVRLIEKERKDVDIHNLILWLGGDLISGSIHDDLAESNQLGPMDAIALVQDTIAGGLNYLLKELPDVDIKVVVSVGNHSRTTQKQRIQTEHENSVEWLMGHSLEREFKNAERLTFVRERAYLTYVDVYGRALRFHHGHMVQYNGGSGGITIPILKAIGGWNTGRPAYLDFFGHFHQLFFGPSFVANGSMIGRNAFAVSIKAAHEPPQQAFCLIDSEYGLTVRAPILLSEA